MCVDVLTQTVNDIQVNRNVHKGINILPLVALLHSVSCVSLCELFARPQLYIIPQDLIYKHNAK